MCIPILTVDSLQPVHMQKSQKMSSKLQQGVPMPSTTAPLAMVHEGYLISDDAHLKDDGSVHMQEGYTSQSTQGLIEVVEVNKSHQLSLSGSGYTSNASKSYMRKCLFVLEYI